MAAQRILKAIKLRLAGWSACGAIARARRGI
jgi:hypothetical protein